jgi:uridine kinase
MPEGRGSRTTATFDEVIACVGQRPHLRLLAIDGLPLAGKTTLADRLAAAIGGACVFLDDFIKPEREWRWRDRPSFPFDFIRHDEFVGTVRSLARDGACRYRPWDYRTGERADADVAVRREDGRPVIVEGVSALHPDLAPLYDLRIWVESDAATVLDAARARGVGSWAREWEVMFVPSVALYLRTDPIGRADLLAAGRGVSVAPT